jgi:hypothetical protein
MAISAAPSKERTTQRLRGIANPKTHGAGARTEIAMNSKS